MSTMVYTAMLQKPLNYSNKCEFRYNKNSECNFCQMWIVMSSSGKLAARMHLHTLTPLTDTLFMILVGFWSVLLKTIVDMLIHRG